MSCRFEITLGHLQSSVFNGTQTHSCCDYNVCCDAETLQEGVYQGER